MLQVLAKEHPIVAHEIIVTGGVKTGSLSGLNRNEYMRAEATAKPLRRGKDNNILEPLKFNSTPSFTPTILSRYPLVLSFVEYLLFGRGRAR